MKPQLMIGAMTQGSGKTIFTVGLLRLLKRRGIPVQPYKCGSDFIDAQLHTLSGGTDSFHLDTWVASGSHIQHIYNKYGEKADVCLTDGTAGLFDGYDRMAGSCSALAHQLRIPVLLVVNARAVSYSLVASLYGFKHYHPSVKLIGIVFNQVVSTEQYMFLRKVSNDAGMNCFGYIPYHEKLRLPSRHACFTATTVKALNETFDTAASFVSEYVEVDRLLDACQRNFPVAYTLPYREEADIESFTPMRSKLRIALADDPAFGLTYKENLLQLEKVGEVVRFSPIYGTALPKADIIYLPGGYPELFARQLYRRKKLHADLKAYAEQGGKILAEDGGLVLLSRSLTVREGGTSYEMAGIFPLDCAVNGNRIQSGYRQMTYNQQELRGYEFHYTSCQSQQDARSMCKVKNTFGMEVFSPVLRYKNVIASYAHLYLGETDIERLWE